MLWLLLLGFLFWITFRNLAKKTINKQKKEVWSLLKCMLYCMCGLQLKGSYIRG